MKNIHFFVRVVSLLFNQDTLFKTPLTETVILPSRSSESKLHSNKIHPAKPSLFPSFQPSPTLVCQFCFIVKSRLEKYVFRFWIPGKRLSSWTYNFLSGIFFFFLISRCKSTTEVVLSHMNSCPASTCPPTDWPSGWWRRGGEHLDGSPKDSCCHYLQAGDWDVARGQRAGGCDGGGTTEE